MSVSGWSPRWFALGCLLLVLTPAWAHRVVLGLWSAGQDIEGELGFSTGDMAAPGTRVEVLGPDGERLGETRVTADGLFRFAPTRAVPHTFRANLGSGHVAERTLPLDEMPRIAASASGTRNGDAAPGEARSIAAVAPVPDAGFRPTDALQFDGEHLKTLIAEAVRREVKPLRRELVELREKIGLQQVLGGLGYIAGITGVLFFVYARRGPRVGGG